MLTAIKKLTVIALVLAFAMPAMAKVTPAHKYQQGKFTGDHKQDNPSNAVTGVPCSSYGWYTEAEALKIFANSFTITALTNNGSCSKQTLSDRTCYSCSCPASYQYVCSPSGRPGYKRGIKPANGANSCTLFSAGKSGDYNKTQPYYTGCDCNASEGYIPNEQFNPSVLGLFSGGSMTTAEGSKGGAAITCYDVNSFSTCITNSGGLNGQTVLAENVTSVTGSVSSASLTFNTEKGVTYTAKPLLNTANKTMAWGGVTFNNKYCTTNATISSPLMTSAPNEECATFSSKKANHYDKTYYYYTGCVNDGFCQTSSNDCVLASTTNITIYTPGNTSTSSLTCAKTTGCKNGLVETSGGAQIFCKEVPSTNYTAAGFNFLTTQANTTAGTKFCARVSCNTANKWEQYPKNIAQYSGSVDYTTYNESSATHYRYDAQKQTAGSNTLVCRQPNGCLTESDWYNFACAKSTGSDVTTPANKPELCWEGYLSYWLPRPSTPVSCTVTNCAQCDSAGKCTKCNDGYTLLSTGVCREFIQIQTCTEENCAQCDSAGKCTKCNDGYDLTPGGKCAKFTQLCLVDTAPNCAECDSTGKCIKCLEGFTSQETENGLSCIGTPCLYCDNCDYSTGSCLKCKDGYTSYIEGGKFKCEKSSLITPSSCQLYGCEDCASDNSSCRRCKLGYTLNNDGACLGPFN